jgi:hypothetical protein
VNRVLLGVPWYVHPAESPEQWQRLHALSDRLDFAVVNVADGPGTADDTYYPDALTSLAGIRLMGYVDVAYGRRPVGDVYADTLAWVRRYGVSGVMLDQVPAGAEWLGVCAEYADSARRAGARRVVANPGVVPSRGHLALFDTICVFEDDATAYAAFEPPGWLRRVPRRKVWHLVHGCALEDVDRLVATSAERHAGVVWMTDGTMPNPWDHVPKTSGLERPLTTSASVT